MQQRFAPRPWHVRTYFASDDWKRELVDPLSAFSPPNGKWLIASVGDTFIGCLALRHLNCAWCEMKRLWVLPKYQGFGVAKKLIRAAVRVGRDHRCRLMRLDTGDLQREAANLYRRMGFHEIGPYYNVPERLLPHMIFFEFDLRATD
jgi:GNAT superfamily N-acetyltransferase